MNDIQLAQMIRRLDSQAEGTTPEWQFTLGQRRLICSSAPQSNRLILKAILIDADRLNRNELLAFLAKPVGDAGFCLLDNQLCLLVHQPLTESTESSLLAVMQTLAEHAERLAPTQPSAKDQTFSSHQPGWTALLKALSDDTRLRLIAQLLHSEQSVEELANRLDLSHYNASKHLRILREAGIIESHKQGRLVVSCIAKAFRRRVKNQVLDLGCCRFEFAQFKEK